MPEVTPLKINVISLGCPKNRVDTEHVLGSLGMPIQIVPVMDKADFVFINTCAFIESATRESIRAILDSINHRSKLKNKPFLIVAGCLVGRYDLIELRKELPEVDLWLTVKDIKIWHKLINKLINNSRTGIPGRFHSTCSSYAWLKIGDGCNNKCTFCTIPSIRGCLRSIRQDELIAEAKVLLSQGIKELIMVAQDVTAWGMDWKPDTGNSCNGSHKNLRGLVEALASCNDLKWLRMLYLYPNAINDELIKIFTEIGDPLLPYFDIPLQHSEKQILKRMGRAIGGDPRYVIEKIYEKIPQAALRTSLIVGFPGETDKDFNNLCKFVQESRFYNLGVFEYFPEDNTPAARFPDQIPSKVKQERKAALLSLQAEISRNILASYVGSKMHVLVDEDDFVEWPGLYKGRVWFQAPEIDGITYISGPDVDSGNLVLADIENAYTYDLAGLQN